MTNRKIGLLVPLFSLPSRYGIGDLGKECEVFIDILHAHKLVLWQLLPLSPINEENSPYSALASCGIDFLYISLERLREDGYDLELSNTVKTPKRVEYTKVRARKRAVLLSAFIQFNAKKELTEFDTFIKSNPWVNGVSAFLAKFYFFGETKWNTWKELEIEDNQELNFEYHFQRWCQFIAINQFERIKKYAHMKGVELIGDIPFYVGFNSVEVYANKELFLLDSNDNHNPAWQSGVPPDYFSATGQNWRNPIWNWQLLEEQDYSLFNNRLLYSAKLFDYLRLDHFRAFDTYYVIPGKDETALNGHWERLNGYKIFDSLYKEYPKAKFICEDLGGDMNERIPLLRDHYELPGMKVIEFTILDDYAVGYNFIRYTGTHDNEPLKSWFEHNGHEDKMKIKNLLEKSELKEYFRNTDSDFEPSITQQLIAYFLKTTTYLGIISIVDLLELGGKENRINLPGTIANFNWSFRFRNLCEVDRKLRLYNIDFLDLE